MLAEIKKKIDENEVISFDIFDTLLLRNVHKPTDLFKILAVKVKEQYNIDNFFEIRVQGEMNARTTAKNSEVNFNEIYSEIEKNCKIPVEKVKQMELELEYEFITPNPFMKEIYEYSKAHGKRVFFISDMYLFQNDIRTLLDKCGYDKDEIFVSNEYRETKGQITLYATVQKKYDLDKSKWLHIGDNRSSDYEKALEFGIHAWHYQNVSTHDDRLEPLSISESIIAGIQDNHLYNGLTTDYWSEFGTKYASPVYFGFAKWLYELTKMEDNLYFLARDGYAIKKVYDLFCAKERNNIHTKYLYCSRQVLKPLARAELSNMTKAVIELTDRWEDTPTLRTILQNAQITDMDSAASIMKAFGFTSLEESIPESKHFMAQKLIARLCEHMRKNILSKKDICLRYLNQELLTSWSRINIMDIGWIGSCQDALESLTQKCVTGYYFGTLDAVKNDKFCSMFGWYFDCGIPVQNSNNLSQYGMMYEFLFSAPHGSTIGYQQTDGGYITPILNEDKPFNRIINEFQTAAIRMCGEYMKYSPYMEDIIRPEFCLHQYHNFLSRKNPRDLQMFKDLQNDWVLGNAKRYPYVSIFTKEDIKNNNREVIRRKREQSLWKGAFLIEADNIDENEKTLFSYNIMKDTYEKQLSLGLGYAKIYFDFGTGFREEDTIIVKMKHQKNRYSFELKGDFHAKAIRIDPIEYHSIQVKDYTLKINNTDQRVFIPKLALIPHNGYRNIRSNDPNFIVKSLTEPITNISFDADMKITE